MCKWKALREKREAKEARRIMKTMPQRLWPVSVYEYLFRQGYSVLINDGQVRVLKEASGSECADAA